MPATWGWTVLVPVKALDRAKPRLRPVAGERTAALALGLGAGVLPDLGGGDLDRAITLAAGLLTGSDVGLGLAVLPADLAWMAPADLPELLSRHCGRRTRTAGPAPVRVPPAPRRAAGEVARRPSSA